MNRPFAFMIASFALPFPLVAACSTSSGPLSENEAGSDAPTTDSPSTPDSPNDSPTGDAPTCSTDGDVVSCCCDGDVQATPMCGGDGALTCSSPYHLYYGADCSRAGGPCSLPFPLDAPNETDAPVTDGGTCVAPQVLRYETAGCGAAAHPVCGSASQDACLGEVCGCDGTTLTKCDYAPAPWAHVGPCSDAGEAGADAADQ